MTKYRMEYEKWLDCPALSESEWRELHDIRRDDEEIENRFFAPLEFGTAGLRGTMKQGLHHMNVHVVRHVTQAFANVICAEGDEARQKGVVICYDSRMNSELFARETACVMAANGVHVRLFDALRPTPELSFAVRYYGAAAGVNITASHNPREYNGYKVYWSDGAQLTPQNAAAIAAEMANIDIFNGFVSTDFEDAKAAGTIEMIGAETDEAFMAQVLAQAIDRETVRCAADGLKIVYTPFHGAGHLLVPEVLKRLGIRHVIPVPEQMTMDGSFPTVESPNPENPEGFYLATRLADEVGGDLIIGTDPDADRIGVLVRREGRFVPITGNQLGVLMLDYVIGAKQRAGTMPEHPAAVKSIVTTEMAREIAKRSGVYMADTFTGFRFMAEQIAAWEANGNYQCMFAFEESYGYMMGDYVRDKDAVTASMLVAEMAAYYSLQHKSLLDALEDLYRKYGWFREKTLNLVMPGLDGLKRMKEIMDTLRENPLTAVAGVPVAKLRDYLTGELSIEGLGVVGTTEISGSNVLYYELTDGSSFIIRPSGTEPKIKIYLLVRDTSQAACDAKIDKYSVFAQTLKEI